MSNKVALQSAVDAIINFVAKGYVAKDAPFEAFASLIKVTNTLTVLIAEVEKNEAVATKTVTFRCSGGIARENNGMKFELLATDYQAIQDQISAGRKIQAVKILREKANWGLLEAKTAVEDSQNFKQWNGVTLPAQPLSISVYCGEYGYESMSADVHQRICSNLRNNDLTSAAGDLKDWFYNKKHFSLSWAQAEKIVKDTKYFPLY